MVSYRIFSYSCDKLMFDLVSYKILFWALLFLKFLFMVWPQHVQLWLPRLCYISMCNHTRTLVEFDFFGLACCRFVAICGLLCLSYRLHVRVCLFIYLFVSVCFGTAYSGEQWWTRQSGGFRQQVADVSLHRMMQFPHYSPCVSVLWMCNIHSVTVSVGYVLATVSSIKLQSNFLSSLTLWSCHITNSMILSHH